MKNKWKIIKRYEKHTLRDCDNSFEPSTTVQGQALSVSEIYKRNLQDQYGQTMPYEGIEDISEDYIDIDDMSFDELRSYKEGLEERLKELAKSQKDKKTVKPAETEEGPPE